MATVVMQEIPAFNADQPGPGFTKYSVGPFDVSPFDELSYGLSCVAGTTGSVLAASVNPMLLTPNSQRVARLGASATISPPPSGVIVGQRSQRMSSPHLTRAASVDNPNLPTGQVYFELNWSYHTNPYPISFSIWMMAHDSSWGSGIPWLLVNRSLTANADGYDTFDATGMDYTTLLVQATSIGAGSLHFYGEQLTPGGWVSSSFDPNSGDTWPANSSQPWQSTQGPNVSYLSSGDSTSAVQLQGSALLLPQQRLRWATLSGSPYPATLTYSVLGLPFSKN